jgi:hypothetical protein
MMHGPSGHSRAVAVIKVVRYPVVAGKRDWER